MFKYDFTCICETYFDSIFSSDNNNLNISGYNLIRADHPSNSKRGSVCIYYKESLAVQTLNNMGLTECLVCKVCLGNKTGNVVVTYRYPSQTYLEFQKILNHFDTLLQNLQNSNPHFTMILGDFCRNSEEETSSQKKNPPERRDCVCDILQIPNCGCDLFKYRAIKLVTYSLYVLE